MRRKRRIKLKRDREEDEEEEGRWCCPQAVRVLKFTWLLAPICPGSAPLLLCPRPSTSHVLHTGKWSLTNLFHYRNDLHDWTPRERESVQDCFHSTAINSLPMGPLRSDQQQKRLPWQCSPPSITAPVLERGIQFGWFPFNWNWVLPTPAKSWRKISLKFNYYFSPTHHLTHTLLNLLQLLPLLIQTPRVW